jgi:Fe-S cluster assembly scaffold protein SufB
MILIRHERIMSKESFTETLAEYSKSDYKDGFTSNNDTELILKDINDDSTQNWYPCSIDEISGSYNFVHKRGLRAGVRSKIKWTQAEAAFSIPWKYPSCILKGDYSMGGFYSVAMTNNLQQVDAGTEIWHIFKNTSNTIISKGISAGKSNNSYKEILTDKAKGVFIGKILVRPDIQKNKCFSEKP